MSFFVKGEEVVGKSLRPLGRPWSLFSRIRILAGVHVLEYSDMYNRVHDMFLRVQPYR